MSALKAHLHAWQQVVEQASPAPWILDDCLQDGGYVDILSGKHPVATLHYFMPESRIDLYNAELIALARTALPLLIQRCLQMQAALELAAQEVIDAGGNRGIDLDSQWLEQTQAALAPFDETPPQEGP